MNFRLSTLSEHPEVRESVVIVREDSPGDKLFEVFKANRVAIAHYQPQPYSGRVVQFCASSPEEDRGWSSLLLLEESWKLMSFPATIMG